MHNPYWIPYVIALFLLTRPTLGEDPKADSSRPSLEQLKWLSGSWSGRQGDSESEEHWIEPKAGLMLGVNRSIRGSAQASFEFLRIVDSGKEIIYYASPSGRGATPFRLIKVAENHVTFLNAENDFPQRIIYQRNGAQLRARIEGKINGQDRSLEWVWKREDRARAPRR